MKNEINCNNCGAALEFNESEIIDKKYIRCKYCNTMNLIDLDDNSLKSIKIMALHSVKEYKIKKQKEHERKNSKVGKLEDTRNLITALLCCLSLFGIIITINMIVALYGANSTKDYIFFTLFLVISLIVSVSTGLIATKLFKEYSLKIEQEKTIKENK